MSHDDGAVLRLVGAIFAEQNDEWQIAERRLLTMNRAAVTNLDQQISPALAAARQNGRR